jgi:hypothetical protein
MLLVILNFKQLQFWIFTAVLNMKKNETNLILAVVVLDMKNVTKVK